MTQSVLTKKYNTTSQGVFLESNANQLSQIQFYIMAILTTALFSVMALNTTTGNTQINRQKFL